MTNETIRNVDELEVGDKVITSKGDEMDKKPLEVVSIDEYDGKTTATIKGDWKNAREYDLVESKFPSPVMPDVGIITVERVERADGGREEVGSADVDLFMEPRPSRDEPTLPMVVPTGDDVSVFDLGDLVADRIEANGKATFPDDLPAEGERQPLGTVYWDERGIPTRLVRDDDVVFFSENGGFDRVEERGSA